MQKPTQHSQTTNSQPGLVISYFGNSVAVEAADGQVFQCHLHRNQDLPVVGDRVRWQLDGGSTGVITEIEPRTSLLSRGEGHGKSKPLAANIDAMIVVMAPPPIFSEYLIDRYLIAAELLNIQPIVVLNKIDLLTPETRDAAVARLEPYRRIPYAVVMSSVKLADGLNELSEQLQHKTAVLVGPSGVGKSSIINALSQNEDIRVGVVSDKGSGKHTTTATRLYHLPHGGHLIDSPGVREFNLWTVNKEDVLRGFKEFQAVQGTCKFRNCQHMKEPECVVLAAIERGQISPQRFESYKELMRLVKEDKGKHTYK